MAQWVVAFIVILISLWPMAIHAENPVRVPEGVVYKRTSTAVNEAARAKIIAAFSAKHPDLDSLSGKMLICGPMLWQALKNEPEMAAMKMGQVIFKMPFYRNGKVVRTQELSGRLLQTAPEITAFWKAFSRHYDFAAEMQVKHLSEADLQTYWAMISFNITEPVYIAQSPTHRILLQFVSPDDLTLAWIDDCQNLVSPATRPEAEGRGPMISQLRMYVPTDELPHRLGTNVKPVADYIKALEKAAIGILRNSRTSEAKGLLIAVGVKSGRRSRVWCQAVEGEISAEVLKTLEKELTKVVPMDIQKGPFAFGMEFRLSGNDGLSFPEIPDSWKQAAQEGNVKYIIPPDDVFAFIWPDDSPK